MAGCFFGQSNKGLGKVKNYTRQELITQIVSTCRAIQHDKDKVRLIAIFLHNYTCTDKELNDFCKLFNSDKYQEGKQILRNISKMYVNEGNNVDKEGRFTPYLTDEELQLYSKIFVDVLEYLIIFFEPL